MYRGRLLLLGLLGLVAACATEPGHPMTMEDLCADRPLVAGGSAEVGLGTAFAPIRDGQVVDLQLGAQGLWMFVVNARAHDMDVGTGDRQGVLDVEALDQSGQKISLDLGCRSREFTEMADGSLQLASPFFLPLIPTVLGAIEGGTVKLHLEVRDGSGRRAIDERSVVVHMPGQNP